MFLLGFESVPLTLRLIYGYINKALKLCCKFMVAKTEPKENVARMLGIGSWKIHTLTLGECSVFLGLLLNTRKANDDKINIY